jgi:hypothetical protein
VQAAELLRARLDGLAVPGVIAHLTAGLGVATLPDHAADGPALIRAAARALRRQGRRPQPRPRGGGRAGAGRDLSRSAREQDQRRRG